ncbi:MAG: hypothetical protein SRB2_00405 [Desulfobacteraceae bacterium Eth-SRB2]|nr:MAG: hypothetical protein SRB2_00405 [Desulfobacteraceae bacterium Eth-SRB2]
MISGKNIKCFWGLLFVLLMVSVFTSPTHLDAKEAPPDLVILYTSDGRGGIKCSG